MSEKYTAVLFSGGLDSAVLIADAARGSRVQPLYVSVGFAWEEEERAMASRFLSHPSIASQVDPIAHLQFDMRDDAYLTDGGGHNLAHAAPPPLVMEHFARCSDTSLPVADRLESLGIVFFAPGNDASSWLDGWWCVGD